MYVKSVKEYFMNLIISADQTGNALMGGNRDITISGRVGLASALGSKTAMVLEFLINSLFFNRTHCWDSIEWDEITHTKYELLDKE